VTVTGKGSGRVSIAGLLCLQPGRRGRLLFRTITHRGRHGERSSFTEADYIAMLDAAHRTLDAPIVLCWDNLNTHVSRHMRSLIDARDWLTVIRLPAYAPDLNPAEGIWSHLKRGIANLTAHGVEHLARTVKKRLRQIQNRPDLAAGFLAQTGMTLEPELPRT
jgi:putative transposase